MKLSTNITASAMSAFLLAGLLTGCDKKASDTATTPAATASAVAPVAPDTSAANTSGDGTSEANRARGPGMADDMAERHRQDMDHDSMRRGGKMGPMGPGGKPTATESPAAAPMKDM